MHACTAATKSNKNKYYYCEFRVPFHFILPHFSSFIRLLTRLLTMAGYEWMNYKIAKWTTATDSAEWRENRKKRKNKTRKFEKWFEIVCHAIIDLFLFFLCALWCEVAEDDQRWTECDTSSLVKCHLCDHIFQSKRDTIVFCIRLFFCCCQRMKYETKSRYRMSENERKENGKKKNAKNKINGKAQLTKL